MSWYPDHEPVCLDAACRSVETRIEGRPRDLGGFSVARVLPSSRRRLVGPFIFLDHMGPAILEAGQGIDVRPHPHIGLATLTYLFEGSLVHRDSLGSEQSIRPGDVNWMVAGRGITHSERTSPEERRTAGALHGMQCWVALAKDHEEMAPRFEHHPGSTIPEVELPGAHLRVIAGEVYGVTSPVGVASPAFYVAADLQAGAELPVAPGFVERSLYVVEGEIECEGERFGARVMPVFAPGPVTIRAQEPSRVILLGGAPLDAERHIWWNFVSSSRERIERAKRDWKEGVFAKVVGDEDEVIPLPE